jgi:cytochrome c553
MKRYTLVTLMMLAGTGVLAAQIQTATSDVLGAHLNYGRGCTACHAPHSGTSGNGKPSLSFGSRDSNSLWAQDASGLYGKTITTGGGKFVEVLPSSMSANTPDVAGILTCLSCHDGNYATGAMMRNKVYEALPATYGNRNNVPTLIGNDGGSAGNMLNDHPIGLSAKVQCSGASNWDCTQSNGVVSMKGPKSSRFVSNYGYFVKPANYNDSAVIVCTTCHEPHVMNVVTVTNGSKSGLPAGNYTTMFFLRAPYNPNDSNPMSNQTAQFCRQCHGDKSNEMNGSSAVTVF